MKLSEQFGWKTGNTIFEKIISSVRDRFASQSHGYAQDIRQAGALEANAVALQLAARFGTEQSTNSKIGSVSFGTELRVDSSQWTGVGFKGFKRAELVTTDAKIDTPVETDFSKYFIPPTPSFSI